MPKLRPAAGLILAAAAGVLWVNWERSETDREGAVAGTAAVENAGVAGSTAPAGRVVHFWTERAEPKADWSGAGPAVALDSDAGAMIAEQAALRSLAKDADLELSPRQWAALAAATAHVQAVRQAYEASIATVAQVPGGRRLEIPAYPAAGDALRVKFQAELRDQLGAETAGEVLAQLGKALEGHFGGFGVSVQTLEFSAASGVGGAQNDFRVTRTVQFWNAVEGSERLTTRRETHFPGLEDPSGHTWAPFLAVLGGGGAGE